MSTHNTAESTYHKSVLVDEVLQYMNPQPRKLYLDVTFGGGGHTKAILEREPNCRVIALDWDMEAIETNQPKLAEIYGDRLTVLWGNFAHLHRILKKEGYDKFDGILADFGTSQHQIFQEAGFSFTVDSPLDMRMSAAHYRKTAADIINHYSERDLANLFFAYGEEKQSRKIAAAIVKEREETPFRTTRQLAKLIESLFPMFKKKFGIHPATRVFQALRIEVNEELENIKKFLAAALEHLDKNGRLVCISFHSLEDRIVKTFFKDHTDKLQILTNKPIQASEEELHRNKASRSAKLRAAERIG